MFHVKQKSEVIKMQQIFTDIPQLANQGIWCLMFVYLFYNTQRRNDEREKRYNSIVEEQSQKLQEISVTLEKINNKLDKKGD